MPIITHPAHCFIAISNPKFIIPKYILTIIAKSGINDAKSTDDLTLLMVGSLINVGHFNKRHQPTGLTTYIYYFIWPPHIPAIVTSGQPVIANKFNLTQPLPWGSPCCSKLKYSFLFLFLPPQVVHISGLYL